MEHLATEALVNSAQTRIDPTLPPKSGDGRRPGTMSTLLSVSLDPMPIETARKLTKRFLAGYPNLGAHDPEGYIAVMIDVMAQFPQWAGERVIVKVDQENPRFPPTDKELRLWLSDIVAPYKFAKEWNARALEQLAERKALEAPESPPSQGSVVTYGEALAKAMTRPIGVFEDHHQGAKRTAPYRG